MGDGTVRLFASQDGSEQLKLAYSAQRRLVELRVGVDDEDDLDHVAVSLAKLDVEVKRDAASLRVADPNSDLTVVLEIAAHLEQAPAELVSYNGPGGPAVPSQQARPGVERQNRVQPRKLGHVVIGSRGQEASPVGRNEPGKKARREEP